MFKRDLLTIFASLLALAACSDHRPADFAGSSQVLAENDSLKKKVASLEAEVAELRVTAPALLADVDAAGSDLSALSVAAKRLKSKFPASPESAIAEKRVSELSAKKNKETTEAQRVAALGFKAFNPNSRFEGDQATIALKAVGLKKTWTFDAYGSEYRFQEAEKGSIFVTAQVTASSKNKDPNLPGLAVYTVDGSALVKIADFSYRFVRWDDYGSYLGNESDYRNDFAHSSIIPMTVGASVETNKVKKPLYLLASHKGCHVRNFERFQSPPVSYFRSGCETLKDSISAVDLKGGDVAVIARID